MENKQNFMGIIIPVVIAVILLSVLPIINSINVDCPPCEECPPCEVCPSYNIGQLNINPDFSSGDYNVDKGSYDYIDSATIIKDENLIPENIKKDVNIFGIIGTYEEVGGGELPINELADGYLVIIVNSITEADEGSGYVKIHMADNQNGTNATVIAQSEDMGTGHDVIFVPYQHKDKYFSIEWVITSHIPYYESDNEIVYFDENKNINRVALSEYSPTNYLKIFAGEIAYIEVGYWND